MSGVVAVTLPGGTVVTCDEATARALGWAPEPVAEPVAEPAAEETKPAPRKRAAK